MGKEEKTEEELKLNACEAIMHTQNDRIEDSTPIFTNVEHVTTTYRWWSAGNYGYRKIVAGKRKENFSALSPSNREFC